MKKPAKLLFLMIFIISCTTEDEIDVSDVFNGVLVKKGICMNYVIQVNDSNFPEELLEINWVDEFSEISFTNVFTLESVCDFPTNIEEGQTFRFFIDINKDNNCPVCLAFTPTPSKRVSIDVID